MSTGNELKGYTDIELEGSGTIKHEGSGLSIDVQNGVLKDALGNTIINWGAGEAYATEQFVTDAIAAGGGGGGPLEDDPISNNQASPIPLASGALTSDAFTMSYTATRTHDGILKDITYSSDAPGTLTTNLARYTSSTSTVVPNIAAVQADGKMFVYAPNMLVDGVAASTVIRVNADGSPDTAYNTAMGLLVSTNITKVLPLADGSVVLSAFAGITINSVAKGNLVKLNADGSENTTFATNRGTLTGSVSSLVLQSSGNLIIAGDITSYAGVAQTRILRITPAGVIDATFVAGTGFNVNVSSVGVFPDDSLLCTGNFTTYKGVSRSHIIKISADGTEDAGFAANIGTGIPVGFATVIKVLSSGKILLLGNMTSYNGTALTPQTTGTACLILNASGTIFLPPVPFSISILNTINVEETPEGKILIVNNILTSGNYNRSYFIAFNADFTEFHGFRDALGSGFNARLGSIKVLPSGKILFYGSFTQSKSVANSGFAYMSLTGNDNYDLIKNLEGGCLGIVYGLAVQSDNKIIVAGNMTFWRGVAVGRLFRLNADLTLDTTFQTNIGAGANGIIYDVAVQPDGKILIGGAFTTFNGITRPQMTRLLDTGVEDTTFATNLGAGPVSGNVTKFFVQSDGKIYVAGAFTTFGGNANRKYVTRLLNTGAEDTAATSALGTSFNAPVYTITEQPNGGIVMVGNFTTLNSVARPRIVRFTSNALAVDATFNTGAGTGFSTAILNAYALALPDNKIIVCSDQTSYNGISRNAIVCINTTGADFPLFYTNMGGFGGGTPNGAILTPNNKIFVTGVFDQVYGKASNAYFVSINLDGTEDIATNTAIKAPRNVNMRAMVVKGDILYGTPEAMSPVGVVASNRSLVMTATPAESLGTLTEMGSFKGIKDENSGVWTYVQKKISGDTAGVTLSVASNAVNYTTTNLPGTLIESKIQYTLTQF